MQIQKFQYFKYSFDCLSYWIVRTCSTMSKNRSGLDYNLWQWLLTFLAQINLLVERTEITNFPSGGINCTLQIPKAKRHFGSIWFLSVSLPSFLFILVEVLLPKQSFLDDKPVRTLEVQCTLEIIWSPSFTLLRRSREMNWLVKTSQSYNLGFLRLNLFPLLHDIMR